MNSTLPPATEASAIERGRVLRKLSLGALVAFVWGVAALPFFAGVMRCPTAQLFHVPCPGCGMTRAVLLLVHGVVPSSLAMHPLAVPTALSQLVLVGATVAATLVFGAPWSLLRARWGRVAIAFVAAVMVADVVLWISRMFGAYGGPVPV